MSGLAKKKYVPNLSNMHAVCEANYARMMRLLPEVDVDSMCYEFGNSYQIIITECCRYTTTLDVKQVQPELPSYMRASMSVRLYHDARMAEVLKAQNVARIEPSYPYPNVKMHQRNEKEMTNLFLAEWLHFCANQNMQTSENA